MDNYLLVNKVIMTILGHWPYQHPMQNRIIRTIFFIGAVCLHIPIFIALYKVRNYFDDVVVRIPMAVTAILFYFHFAFLVIKSPQMLLLLNQISQDFKELQPFENEFAILQKSAGEGRLAVLTYALYTTLSTALYCSMALIPQILDILLPLNETRPKTYVAEVDYVIFQKEGHYCFIYFHTTIVGSYVIATIVACDIMLYSFIQHGCGMLRVLWSGDLLVVYPSCSLKSRKCKEIRASETRWYRLQNVIPVKSIIKGKYCIKSEKVCQDVVAYIKLHINVLEYTKGVESCYSTFLFFSIGFVILIMSFQGAMILIKIDDTDFVIRYGTFYCAQFIHVLYHCVPGQNLVDNSTTIFDCIYDIEWYDMPQKVQKLLLFMMTRSLQESKVTIGKLFVLSLETFSLILKTIFSYLSVLISMRN